MRLARLEYLIDRRPLLLNRVLLRQNPHNVQEWLKRVKLFEEKSDDVIFYLEIIYSKLSVIGPWRKNPFFALDRVQ